MKPLCQFDDDTLTCRACGYRARRLPTFRVCGPVASKPQRWRPFQIGDAVERWLTAIGITRERVERWTRTAGKPGGCGCESRKRWLNEWGERVQIEARRRLVAVHDWYLGRRIGIG